ncbi:MAG TPA: rRNA maturation RNase YbeY, partial [Candidatus Rothia avicola]|nr:rRNA maturation RNase YbeY [Candidatus Rothia avicola]
VAHAFAHMKVSPETELSIAIVGESEMERIHIDWMDLPGPTDVMSFPMDELAPGTDDQPATGVLGDIVLCPPVAARQGADAGHSTLDELCLLTTHGILHCLGFDHATAEEEAEMFGIQRTILEEFLGRPAPVETRH